MQAPLQARNDSDAAQTDTIRTVAQKRVLADNRPSAVAQRKLTEMMNNSPRVLQQRALSDAIHNSPRMVAQRHEMNALFGGAVKPPGEGAMPAEASSAQREEKTNKTGLPNQLKSGIESLSGISMDHVTVHYNSDRPAQLQAHAYAQGSEIHLKAGQERHLPHETWHVVQQAQGRVRPTLQMKAGAVNDDPSLEKEADMMGEKAAQFEGDHGARNLVAKERVTGAVPQRVAGFALMANSLGTRTGQESGLTVSDAKPAAATAMQFMLINEVEDMNILANWILLKDPGSTVVGMGGSPAPVVALLKSRNIEAYSIPLSIKEYVNMAEGQLDELRKMMEGRIDGLSGITNILVIDVGATGNSVMNGARAIKQAYPDKQVSGLAFAASSEEKKRQTKIFTDTEEKVNDEKFPRMSSVVATDVNLPADSAFFDKLVGSGYKQYRDVGVFKPHFGDRWDAYLADEREAGPAGFDHGSRERHQELINHLKFVNDWTSLDKPDWMRPDGIGNPAYETGLHSYNDEHPKNAHKNSEDAQHEARLKRINSEREPAEEGANQKGCCITQ